MNNKKPIELGLNSGIFKDSGMYIIVKHAGVGWKHHFDKDPKQGAHISFSATSTYTGQKLGIQLAYFNREQALADCLRMNEDNPTGNYAVCPVLTPKLKEPRNADLD